jgi:hypothetical protein
MSSEPNVEATTNDAVTSAATETIVKEGPSNTPQPATELLGTETGDVQATTVTMERAGAGQVSAERVTMTNSGARTVTARSAQLDRSGVVSLQSEHTVLQSSSAVGVMADEVRLVKSSALFVAAESATVEEGTRILVYVGPSSPTTRPVVDAVGAAAFGAGLGLALVTLSALLRRLFLRS